MDSPAKNLRIGRILHAGYIFELSDCRIAFDTIFENPFSRNCYAYPDVRFDYDKISQLKFDAIFISHFHDDHFSLESLRLIDRQAPIYFYCVHEEMFDLLKELGFLNVHSLKLNSSVQIGPFEVIPRRALDVDVDSVFQIKVKDLNILNVVDSWIDYETLDLLCEQGPWDLIMWPFQTMRELEVLSPRLLKRNNEDIPFEWIEQIQKLKPKMIIPSSCQFIHESWSWYRHAYFPTSYKKFKDTLGEALPGCEVHRLNPGQTLEYCEGKFEQSSALDWISPIGDQDVDYEYDAEIEPPPTSEVARYFPPLSQQEVAKVLSYCTEEVLKVYKVLESTEPYFETERYWKLSVFDSFGKGYHFFYLVHQNQLQQLSEAPASIHWFTEVPMTRFFAALENGETLTSMYMRINEGPFDQKTTKDLLDVDILADPLVRCLFSGSVSSYQRAQLKRLKAKS